MKKKALFVIALIVMLCTACSSDDKGNGTAPFHENLNFDLVPNEEETEILCRTYINEDRIREGKLYGYQNKQLLRIRYAENYLAQKYPDMDFHIWEGAEKPDSNDCWKFSFTNLSQEEYYHLYVLETPDGYEAVDEYSIEVLAQEYDNWLSEELSCFLGSQVYTETAFWGNSWQLCSLKSIDDILLLDDQLPRNTNIYTYEVQDPASLADKLIQYLKDKDIYGSYSIYAADELMSYVEDGRTIHEYLLKNHIVMQGVDRQTWN